MIYIYIIDKLIFFLKLRPKCFQMTAQFVPDYFSNKLNFDNGSFKTF